MECFTRSVIEGKTRANRGGHQEPGLAFPAGKMNEFTEKPFSPRSTQRDSYRSALESETFAGSTFKHLLTLYVLRDAKVFLQCSHKSLSQNNK
jgi:hypothetical protein